MWDRIPMFAEEWFSLFIKGQKTPARYSELKCDLILKTLEELEHRIVERFPGSGLSQVCAELRQVGAGVEQLVERLRRPFWGVRLAVILLSVLFVAVIISIAVTVSVRVSTQVDGISDLLQGIESAINEIVFLGIALYFLGTLEGRLKRYVAIRALHRLRSIAHVVDMHQLTKDPAYLLAPPQDTAHSPKRTMTPYELTRYLDYCAELLSIVSKLAALHAQYLSDPVVLNAVNDVEQLSQGLAGKVWQKIMILDIAIPKETQAE
ncbi:MAG: hypothetical protein ACK4TA_08315 [Saprospiraceae bacterium]